MSDIELLTKSITRRTNTEWVAFFQASVPGPWAGSLHMYELGEEIGAFARAVRADLLGQLIDAGYAELVKMAGAEP